MLITKSPTQIREEQARGLISLLNDIKAKIVDDKIILKNSLIHLNGVLERFYDYKDTQLHTAEKLKSYILVLERKKCDKITFEPRCNVQDIAEDTKSLIDDIISEVKALGIPTKKAIDDHSVNVSVSQNQKQSQHQDVIVNILLDAIKDELTGRQQKEIFEIAKNSETPEEARKGILDKIKEFGEDVSANIIANILTNPSVWNIIGKML